MKKVFFAGMVLGLVLYGGSAQAVSLSIATSTSFGPDLFPTSVTVGILISDLGQNVAPSVGAFDFDLIYESDTLGLSSVVFSPSLGDPDFIRFSSSPPDTLLVPDIFGAGDAITDATLLSPGRVNMFNVSLLSVAQLNSAQNSALQVATLRFDVGQRNSSSTLGLFVNGLSDELGNSLAVSNATDVGGVAFIQGPTVPTGPIPEPSTVLLFGSGLAGLLGWRWKRSKVGND